MLISEKSAKECFQGKCENPETGLLKENKAVSTESIEIDILSDESTTFLDEKATGLYMHYLFNVEIYLTTKIKRII